MIAVKKKKVKEGRVEIYVAQKTVEFYATNYDGIQSLVILTHRQWQEINDFVTKHRKAATD